jgi:membrane-bound ClpP family serine protease
MSQSPDSSFTSILILAIALIFIGGAIEGPTWAKLVLLVGGVALILFGAIRRVSAKSHAEKVRDE